MVDSTSPRPPSTPERALIVALALYAVAVVGPDTLRPLLQGDLAELLPWYPIATVGFEADNDGNVIAVDEDGPAYEAGLRPGQHIDLAFRTAGWTRDQQVRLRCTRHRSG
jgi:hypothetical protein